MFRREVFHQPNLVLLGYLLNCVAGIFALYLVY
jgi:hypothetical protein